jgi:hypothetical protein
MGQEGTWNGRVPVLRRSTLLHPRRHPVSPCGAAHERLLARMSELVPQAIACSIVRLSCLRCNPCREQRELGLVSLEPETPPSSWHRGYLLGL